jgi:GH35 family endo-1,4-beta-xylanase
MNASEIRQNQTKSDKIRQIAFNYDKDYLTLPDGVELWGTRDGDWWLTGIKWFLLKGNTILFSQYQPPCESEKEAKRLRTKWLNELMRSGEGL